MGPNRSVLRVGLMEGGGACALAQMRLKSLPVVSSTVAELEWGPLYRSIDDLEYFLRELKKRVSEERGMEIRVHPKSTYSDTGDASIRTAMQSAGFGWDRSQRPYQTVILNLLPTLEELQANLHPGWRRHLRKAEKSGLTLTSGCSVEYFDRFTQVYREMWGSKQFATGVRHPIIRDLMSILPENEQLRITIAQWEGRDVGASVCAAVGDTVLYFLGASTPSLRENCRPGYLLHWNNVRRAKEEGFRWYDLGGIVDTGEGVNQFKRGMGAKEVVFPGCFVVGANHLSSRFYHLVEDSFRGIRHWVTGR